MNSIVEDILMHYGMPRRSGRYPYGSGENPYQHTHITLHMKKLFHIAIEIIGRCHVLWEPIYHKATISVHSHFYFHCQMDRSVSKPETTFHHRLL